MKNCDQHRSVAFEALLKISQTLHPKQSPISQLAKAHVARWLTSSDDTQSHAYAKARRHSELLSNPAIPLHYPQAQHTSGMHSDKRSSRQCHSIIHSFHKKFLLLQSYKKKKKKKTRLCKCHRPTQVNSLVQVFQSVAKAEPAQPEAIPISKQKKRGTFALVEFRPPEHLMFWAS